MPFSKVFDQRYLNKTCKLEAAIADVQKKIEQVKTDLETIESVCGKYKLNAKDIYVRTLDLSKAMAEEKRLKDLEEKLESLDNEMAANATNSNVCQSWQRSGNRPKQIWNIKWSVGNIWKNLQKKSMHRMRISIGNRCRKQV